MAKVIDTPGDGPGRNGRLTNPARRATLCYLPVLAAVLLMAVTASRWPYFPGDLELARAAQAVEWPLFALLMIGVSEVGAVPLSLLVPALVGIALVAYRQRLEAALLLVALASGPAHYALKLLVGRARPTPELLDVYQVIREPSFPSGHVVFFVAFYGFLFYLVALRWRPSLGRAAILCAIGALVALVGLSRVFLGAHFPSDVAGGYLFGGLWLAAMVEVHRRHARRGAR